MPRRLPALCGVFAAGIFFLASVCSGAQTHVVHVSIDGLGAVYLLPYITAAPGQFPTFVRLRSEGASTLNARCDYFSSETIPNHATMFTGRPTLQPQGFPNTVHHGYLLNAPNPNDTFHNSGNPQVPYKASFFDVAHDHGLKTALYASKTRLSICDQSYNETHGALDLIAPDYGRDKIDLAVINDGPLLSAVVEPLLQDLNSATPSHYSFIHLREPDTTGHNLNWGSVAYSNMVRTVDQELGRILTAINQNSALFNRTFLIVSADHGGGGESPNQHGDPGHVSNYTIPFFLWGPGVRRGADLHSLFSNRADPGTKRTDYGTTPQPIRNGDGGNLALALLGLPPVPGSFMIPLLAGPRLMAARQGINIKVMWQDPERQLLLKYTRSLTPPINWQTISAGITEESGFRVYREASGLGSRFFRLQRD